MGYFVTVTCVTLLVRRDFPAVQNSGLQIEVAQIILHKTDQPDIVVNLSKRDVWWLGRICLGNKKIKNDASVPAKLGVRCTESRRGDTLQLSFTHLSVASGAAVSCATDGRRRHVVSRGRKMAEQQSPTLKTLSGRIRRTHSLESDLHWQEFSNDRNPF